MAARFTSNLPAGWKGRRVRAPSLFMRRTTIYSNALGFAVNKRGECWKLSYLGEEAPQEFETSRAAIEQAEVIAHGPE